jgi:hypothetical protein
MLCSNSMWISQEHGACMLCARSVHAVMFNELARSVMYSYSKTEQPALQRGKGCASATLEATKAQ